MREDPHMTLQFTDAYGNEGRIADDFDVEYEGPLGVVAYVRDAVAGAESDERAIEALILGLVADLDVREVRREPDPSTSTA